MHLVLRMVTAQADKLGHRLERLCCKEAKALWILHINITVSQDDGRPWGRVEAVGSVLCFD